MIRKRHFVVLGIAAVQGFGLAPANASAALDSQAGAPAWNASMKFDLSRDCPRDVSGPSSQEKTGRSISVQSDRWDSEGNGFTAKEQLGPEWSYQPLASGPVIQFAALGAGKKERPGLAHVALDWNF